MNLLFYLLLALSFAPNTQDDECKVTVSRQAYICESEPDLIAFNYESNCKIYYSKLQIRNRWGQEIFKEVNKKGKGWKGWDGKIGTRFAPHAESLYFLLEYKVSKKSELKTLEGNFSVLHKCN